MDPGIRSIAEWRPQSRAAWAVLIAGVVALALMDIVVLRGERVGRASIPFDRDEPAVFRLERIGERHTFEITTRRYRRGEHLGRTVGWRLEDPHGQVVVEGSEITAHKERFFDYTPTVAGDYTLHVEDEGLVLQSRRGSARVDVYVGDRRILSRLFAAF